jgi:hypothetical protein
VLYSVVTRVSSFPLFVHLITFCRNLGNLLKLVSCVMTDVTWMSTFFPDASVLIDPKVDYNTMISRAILLLFAYDEDL